MHTKEVVANVPVVAEYYNGSHLLYRLFNGQHFHYGLYEKGVVSKRQALERSYHLIRDLLYPQENQLVLDAGCGMGTASLWLAGKTKASFIGITLSDVQLKAASRFAEKKKLTDRVSFREMSYFDLEFPKNFFDSVFGIESFCYSYPQPKVAYEQIYKVLKPCGRFVIVDGVLLRKPETEEELMHWENVRYGFKLSSGSTTEDIVKAMKDTGFISIRVIDKTSAIKPYVEKYARWSSFSWLLKIFHLFGMLPKTGLENILVPLSQKFLYDNGIFGYKVFYAEKPI